MNDAECYYKLYGTLIYHVQFYREHFEGVISAIGVECALNWINNHKEDGNAVR
jgi:hypothetical protein